MMAKDASRKLLLEQHLREKNVGALRVAALLIVTLVPVFWILDWFVIRDYVWAALSLRAFSTVYGLLILAAISRTPQWVRRYVDFLGVSLTLSVAWGISLMCWLGQGYESPYYAGINLLVIGVGFLFAWRPRLSMLFGCLVYGFYMAPLAAGMLSIQNATVTLGNQFFLVSTIIVIVAAQRHRFALESREFFGTLDLQATKADLEQAFERLKELDRVKSQFFNNITHELRTPLTVILSPLDGMLEGEMGQFNEQQKDYLRPIHRNAMKLLKLINDLLDVAKIEDGHLRLNIERTDLRGLITEVVEYAVPLAERKDITIDLLIRSARDDVYVDVEQIDRVIINLVSNALKFTEPGGRVTVWMEALDNEVQIGVEDTGIGIPESEFDAIFGRFSQADGSVTRRYGGTGIGLALAKELVELHSGTINVRSQVGRGSLFVIHLRPGKDHLDAELLERRHRKRPTQRTKRSDDREPREWLQELVQSPEFRFLDLDHATERRLVSRPDKADKATKVLVVEDNVEVLRFVHLQLHEEHAVYLAPTGERGLDLAREEQPDVIITDFMMPGIDGMTMLRTLGEDPATADIPSIMLTAKDTVQDRLNAREAGADIYLSKPFSPRELRLAVRKLMEKRGRQASIMMREHVKSLEVISAGLAHEIHNPLSYIKNAVFVIGEKVELIGQAMDRAQLADDTDLTRLNRAREQITRMRGVARRGVERIDQIVALVRRYAREGYPDEPTPLVIDEAVNDVGQLIAARAAKQVTVEVSLNAPDAAVNCIPEEMHQVIRNLWQNALDAVGDAGQVRISTQRDGDSVLLEVADNGKGIPADQLRRIFTPFFTTKDPGQGMGLGLAISHQVVDQAGGKIRVQSAVGQGTTFQVRLPVVTAATTQATTATAS